MAVELLQVGDDRLVGDEVAVDGEVGVGAGVVLARLEQGALGEQVRVDVLGQLDQHMGLARLGRALLQPQHVAVVELEVLGGEPVGLAAGVLEQLAGTRGTGRSAARGRPTRTSPRTAALASSTTRAYTARNVSQIAVKRLWVARWLTWSTRRGARAVGARVRREVDGDVGRPVRDIHALRPLGRQAGPGDQGVERLERLPEDQHVAGRRRRRGRRRRARRPPGSSRSAAAASG